MSEEIRFLSPEEKEEQKIFETLKKEGGIFYRSEVDPETGEEKHFVNILGVEVETYASKEDIKEIKKEIVLSEVDQRMLRTIAECYKLRQPLMIEGDSGVGKTFLMKKFVQLIHGEEAPILELVGTPRTSELEILGHWAPASSAERSSDPIVQDTITRYNNLMREYQKINDEYDRRYQNLKKDLDDGTISQDEFNEKIIYLNNYYRPLQERYFNELQVLWQSSRDRVEWEFKEGALLQAYAGREGRGYILIVDEFNLIPPNYQQIFLQIVGKEGALSESISWWGNAGRTRYPRGKDTWICFASNYPEKTPGRSEVVAPMTDRLVWITISPEEVEKKKEVLRRTAGGRLKKRQKKFTQLVPETVFVPARKGLAWDRVLDEKLGEQIADAVDLLDRAFEDYYKKVGDRITDRITIEGEGRRRSQQFELSGRNPLRIYSYLDYFQVRNPKTGQIDFTETLFKAFERYYLSRLVDIEARKKMEEVFKQIMEGDIGKIKFEGKTMTRKEVLDILVERASLSEEEREKQRQEEVKKAQYEFTREVRHLIDLPDLPEEVREKLKALLE